MAENMSRNFNYPHTCPKIDKNIKNFQTDLASNLNSLVEEINPLFYSTTDGTKFIEAWEQIIYDLAEPCFEDTRQSNSDMRSEVETIIDGIIEERDEYKRLSEYWESYAEQKDKEIEDLQEEISAKEAEIETLKDTITWNIEQL